MRILELSFLAKISGEEKIILLSTLYVINITISIDPLQNPTLGILITEGGNVLGW
jgi:hypothetical protein